MKRTSKGTSASRKRSHGHVTPDLKKVLAAIDAAVSAAGARWYLFGAQAVAFHGAPRSTKDVEDVRRLVRRRRDMNLAEVRELIAMLQADLGDSTVMRVLDGVLAEAGVMQSV